MIFPWASCISPQVFCSSWSLGLATAPLDCHSPQFRSKTHCILWSQSTRPMIVLWCWSEPGLLYFWVRSNKGRCLIWDELLRGSSCGAFATQCILILLCRCRWLSSRKLSLFPSWPFLQWCLVCTCISWICAWSIVEVLFRSPPLAPKQDLLF